MKTPQERYNNDAQYRAMVDTLEQLIHKAHFTPSELREMVVYACIQYELTHVSRSIVIPHNVEEAFRTLDEFRRMPDPGPVENHP